MVATTDVELMAEAHDMLRVLCRTPNRKQTVKMWSDAYWVADKLAARLGVDIEAHARRVS